MGTYYTAIYHLNDGSVSREFWVIPASQFPVQVSAIKSYGSAYFRCDADGE